MIKEVLVLGAGSAGLIAALRGSRFQLRNGAIDGARMERVANEFNARREAERTKLERMALYAQSGTCRWRALLEYFEEDDGFERCGHCDNCIDPPERRYTPPQAAVRATASAPPTTT